MRLRSLVQRAVALAQTRPFVLMNCSSTCAVMDAPTLASRISWNNSRHALTPRSIFRFCGRILKAKAERSMLRDESKAVNTNQASAVTDACPSSTSTAASTPARAAEWLWVSGPYHFSVHSRCTLLGNESLKNREKLSRTNQLVNIGANRNAIA
jgi:hypothetical protein